MKKAMVCVLVLLLALPVLAQHEALQQSLQVKMDSLLALCGAPGMTFGLALNDDDVLNLASGVEDWSTRVPMKPTARMFGGSTGKIWVAAVALKLAEEGRFNLDDKVSKYLGGQAWYDSIPNSADISIRNLLNHTTGIPRHVMKPEMWDMIHADPDRILSKIECLSVIAGDQPVHAAGQGWGYSDTNYIILGLVIEKVTGQKYEDILRNRILKPYKLMLTAVQDSRVIKDLPSGYTGEDAPFYMPPKVPVDGRYPIHPMFEWQGGGLVGNSLDMARWARILWGGEWLGEAMMAELSKPVNLRSGQPAERGWGLGTHIFVWQGHKVMSHGGIFPGYETAIAYFPEWGFAVALQVNADQTSGKLQAAPMGVLLQLAQVVMAEAYPAE